MGDLEVARRAVPVADEAQPVGALGQRRLAGQKRGVRREAVQDREGGGGAGGVGAVRHLEVPVEAVRIGDQAQPVSPDGDRGARPREVDELELGGGHGRAARVGAVGDLEVGGGVGIADEPQPVGAEGHRRFGLEVQRVERGERRARAQGVRAMRGAEAAARVAVREEAPPFGAERRRPCRAGAQAGAGCGCAGGIRAMGCPQLAVAGVAEETPPVRADDQAPRPAAEAVDGRDDGAGARHVIAVGHSHPDHRAPLAVVADEAPAVGADGQREVRPRLARGVDARDGGRRAAHVRAVGHLQVPQVRVEVGDEAEAVGPDGDRRVGPHVAAVHPVQARDERVGAERVRAVRDLEVAVAVVVVADEPEAVGAPGDRNGPPDVGALSDRRVRPAQAGQERHQRSRHRHGPAHSTRPGPRGRAGKSVRR